MSDQTPAPDYVPQPRSSGAGTLIVVIVVVLLMILLCGGALLLVGMFAFTAVESRPMPAPVAVPQPVVPAPVQEPDLGPQPVQESGEPVNP